MLLDAGKQPRKVSFEEMAGRNDSKWLKEENERLRGENKELSLRPTTWAYKQVCKALRKHSDNEERLKEENKQLLNRLNEVPE